MDTWDSYLINDSNILKNKLNITNQEELKKIEDKIVLEKLAMLSLIPTISACNKESLFEMHDFIFGNIYPFAGDVRTCSLSKNRYNFSDPKDIVRELDETMERYNKELDTVTSSDMLAYVLGPFYYDLIRIHPFREGNGRTIREFIREVVLLKSKNYSFNVELDYSKIVNDERLVPEMDNLMLGTVLRYMYPSLLEDQFRKCLVSVEEKKKR